jgi:proteasome lid subunit RPN8/RPN11
MGGGAGGGRGGAPVEVCGILAGKSNLAERIYKGSNVDPSPVSYQLDPREQLRIEKELRRDGLRMLAIYHSHPAGRAVPSAKDIELGVWDAVYIIVGLSGGPEVKGWRFFEGGKALEAEIKVV